MADVSKVNGVNVIDGNGVGPVTFLCEVTGSTPVTAAELNAAVAGLAAKGTIAGVANAGTNTVLVLVQGGPTPDVANVSVAATF